jgi:N-acyl-phosphatidylethanolamine-hydrolysing phospholipase D
LNSDSFDGKVRWLTHADSLLAVFVVIGCSGSFLTRFISRAVEHSSDPIELLSNKISNAILPDVGLSILWIGHATVLIQIQDKIFLTDPVFTNKVGLVSERVVEPGIDPATLPRIDYVLISHTHFDHLNYSTLSALPKKSRLLIPYGAAHYTPELGFREIRQMKPWDEFYEDSVHITSVPSQHFGGRYGFDIPWMAGKGYCGYVIQYKGRTVYFAGDTGYRDSMFTRIGESSPIDVALIPIAPIEPRQMMSRVHLDPHRAVQAFKELRAKLMIPIHHRTFVQGLEPQITFAQSELEEIVKEKASQEKIYIIKIRERRIVE